MEIRMNIRILAIGILAISLFACQPYTQKQDESTRTGQSYDMDVSKSVTIPSDGGAPIAGVSSNQKSDTIITFSEVGQVIELKNGQSANFIYDGINPEETYIKYVQTLDGYTLELAYRDQKESLEFSFLCQTYVVANPMLTSVQVPDNLKYEQIIWTPRSDGTWEVRLGSTERGCASKALDQLNKLRTKDYEGKVPKKTRK
jgi:hypothetical protein